MLVAIINPDRTIERKEIDGSLESMQAIVGGLIQPLDVSRTLTLWVNEEGLMLDLEDNLLASGIVNQVLVGTAFLTGGTDEEGNTLGLNPDYFEVLDQYAEATLMLFG